WAMNPADAEAFAFGVERVWNNVSAVATTITALLAVVMEQARRPNGPLASEERKLRAAIQCQSSCIDTPPPHLKKIVEPHLERQEKDGSKPDAVATVHALIARVLDKDALTRFEGSHAPKLTDDLVRRVGERIGYIGAEKLLGRPGDLKKVSWFVDTRPERLIPHILAQRHHATPY